MTVNRWCHRLPATLRRAGTPTTIGETTSARKKGHRATPSLSCSTPTGRAASYASGAPTRWEPCASISITRPSLLSKRPFSALLTGRFAPFLPPFAGTTAKGGNLEFPLPFRKHVKVAWEGGGGFYQITYRRYVSSATDVTSFDLSSLDPDELDSVRIRLQQPAVQGSNVVSDQALLTAASPEMTIAASPSGEAILELQVRPSLVDAASLRGSILSLRFDDRETVRAPLGDFFGAGPGLLPHATLPLEATADGLLSARFVMPFAQSAVVHIDPAPGLAATVTVLHQAAVFDPNTYYFHAHWSAPCVRAPPLAA